MQKQIVHIVLLLLVGSVVYSNSINVPFILDDHYSIDYYGKKDLAAHVLHGSSRRVADITFALNYRLHGLHVSGYHIANLAIHISSAILLYFIIVSAMSALRVSFSGKGRTAEAAGSLEAFIPLAAALLFVSHPIQTQAVTYIIQRYTSLATFFYLLSALAFLRARLAVEVGAPRWKPWFLMSGTVVAGLLAVGSKQIAVTLPLMLFCLEIFLFRGRLINRRFYMIVGGVAVIVLALVLFKWHGSSLDDFLYDLRHATAENLHASRTTYFLTQTRVVATYLGLLCLPLGQSLVHDSPIYKSIFAVPVMASLALHLFLLATAAILFRMSGRNLQSGELLRGVFQRLASLGIIWFYIAMSIESSIFPIIDIIFEHRIYLPSVGFFMTITACAALFFQGRRNGVKEVSLLLAVVCISLGGMTIARNRVWNDALTLWQDAASKAPNKWLAQANLANQYLARNMPLKALPLFIRAIELNPGLFHLTKVNIGDTLKALNIFESRFTTGVEYISPGGPFGSGTLDYRNLARWEGVISNNLGLSYEYLQQTDKAMNAYKFAVTINPVYDLAWYNLALLAARLGDAGLADEAAGKLKAINPALAGHLPRR